jgi:four helix bundle protein
MNEQEMKDRTKAFALRVIRLVDSLPTKRSADVIGRQLLRSGTSVGANYRSCRRARSSAEFLSKLGTVEEESDETSYWLELLAEANLVPPKRLCALLDESNQITAIVVATIRAARRNARPKRAAPQTSAIRHPISDIK